MKDNKELKQANNKLEEMSHDIHMQRIAEWRQKAIFEENTARTCGFKNGIEQGIKQGIERKTYDLVKKMLENNESIDKIQLYSGYSKEQIEKIRAELKAK